MNTLQVADAVLDGFKNEKLTEERINFLKTQANEQLDELATNQEAYDRFLEKVNPPEKVDNLILWMLIMSDEDIVEEYIDIYKKDFREIIPVADLADLLVYAIYLKKFQNIELEGLDYLLAYKSEGTDDMDQYAFTNIFVYIQKTKEVQIQF